MTAFTNTQRIWVSMTLKYPYPSCLSLVTLATALILLGDAHTTAVVLAQSCLNLVVNH